MSTSTEAEQFFTSGWCTFPFDPRLAHWLTQIEPYARQTITAPEHARWHRSGNTWFAGVNVLPNDGNGCVGQSSTLACHAVDFIHEVLQLRDFQWDAAQISVCYPGYPARMSDESDAVFDYRIKRDAAHVDGIERVGPQRRRFLSEHHAFVLGLPITPTSAGASPLVLWEGSHHIVRQTLIDHLSDLPVDRWQQQDITRVYQAMRRSIFAQCRRVVVTVQPGEAYLTHRLALHGIQPWQQGEAGGLQERIICYFRPAILSAQQWLYDK